ncbi:MAG: DUF535 family protein [Terracidiphilus sp.]
MTVTVNSSTVSETRTITADSELPARLPAAAHQKNPWSLLLLGGILWRGITHIRIHREVLRILLRIRPYTEYFISTPSFAYKYLTPIYLVRGFTVAERATCFLYHYKRLHSALPDSLLRRILREDVAIHEIPEGDNRIVLTMGKSMPGFLEGELSLHLRVDGKIVYVLSFNIVPGWVVKSQAEEILLITRLQGVKGAFPPISYATKTLHDVAPGALLFAALQGIAHAFGIGEITAVSSVMQSCYRKVNAADFKEAYDDFFTELGIPKGPSGYFRIPLPFQEKPLAFIKQGHKIRTREKRAFKQQIKLACASFFEKFAPDASRKLPV